MVNSCSLLVDIMYMYTFYNIHVQYMCNTCYCSFLQGILTAWLKQGDLINLIEGPSPQCKHHPGSVCLQDTLVVRFQTEVLQVHVRATGQYCTVHTTPCTCTCIIQPGMYTVLCTCWSLGFHLHVVIMLCLMELYYTIDVHKAGISYMYKHKIFCTWSMYIVVVCTHSDSPFITTLYCLI